MILACIYYHQNIKLENPAFPSRETLAQECGCKSVRSIDNAIYGKYNTDKETGERVYTHPGLIHLKISINNKVQPLLSVEKRKDKKNKKQTSIYTTPSLFLRLIALHHKLGH